MEKRMKQWVSIFVCVLMVCSLVSCRKNPATKSEESFGITETLQVVSGYEEQSEYGLRDYEEISQAAYPLIQVGYPSVKLRGEDAENYPRLAVVLEEKNAKIRAEKLDFLDATKMDADILFTEDSEEFIPYQSTEKASVRRGDSKALSILYDGYVYSGGMHGFSYYRTETYDPATGKELKLSDVVTDVSVLPTALWPEIDILYPDLPLFEGVQLADLLQDDRADWTLDYHGITFYFNPYDLAPYAYGRQQVTLIYSEFPDLVKEEYRASPVAYGVELPQNCNFYYDVNEDGVADTISWVNRGEHQGMSDSIVITLNGTEYEFSEYCLSNQATFLKTRTGEYYLYVQNTMENDARETHIFRLGNTVEQTGSMQGGMHWDSHGWQDVLTNPDDFQMSTRTQMASTVTGYRDFTVGEKGLPQSTELFWHFEKENQLTFTVLFDFVAELYNEETNTAKGSITVAKGEQVTYYATDGESYIWLLLEDGTLCRKKVQMENHRMMLDGYFAEEVFEGVVYAG